MSLQRRSLLGWLLARAIALAVLTTAPCLRAEDAPHPGVFDVVPPARDASLELRVSYYQGTCRPDWMLVAWRSGSEVFGRRIEWVHVGAFPREGDRAERHEWRAWRREALHLLRFNCRTEPRVRDGIAWCTCSGRLMTPGFERELLDSARPLFEEPFRSTHGLVRPDGTISIQLDGPGFYAELREGGRVQHAEWSGGEVCGASPCADAERVMNIYTRLRWDRPFHDSSSDD